MSAQGGAGRFELTPAAIEAIAERAAAILAERQGGDPDAWLTTSEAAAYLRCTSSRIYGLVSARRIPFAKDGSRTLFRRSELDGWVRTGGAKCP